GTSCPRRGRPRANRVERRSPAGMKRAPGSNHPAPRSMPQSAGGASPWLERPGRPPGLLTGLDARPSAPPRRRHDLGLALPVATTALAALLGLALLLLGGRLTGLQ